MYFINLGRFWANISSSTASAVFCHTYPTETSNYRDICRSIFCVHMLIILFSLFGIYFFSCASFWIHSKQRSKCPLDVLKQAELFQGCSGWHFIWTSIGSASFGLLITLSVSSYIQLFLGWMKVMENYNRYLKSNRMLPFYRESSLYIWPVAAILAILDQLSPIRDWEDSTLVLARAGTSPFGVCLYF